MTVSSGASRTTCSRSTATKSSATRFTIGAGTSRSRAGAKRERDAWLRAFFGEHVEKIWVNPPQGEGSGVWY